MRRRAAPGASRAAASFGAAPFVAVPSAYIDVVMPALSDCEWRVLCVVIRQTLGWIDDASNGNKRKERDWITHGQFRSRTSRSGDSVSRAIASLVRLGLVVVESESGEVLALPSERRRARSRLFYRLTPLPDATSEKAKPFAR